MRRLLVVLALGVLAFGAITLAALEGREVVVLQTATGRRTRTWIADEDGVAWIEAANPERPFLRELRDDGTVVLERRGTTYRCTAEVQPNPEGHAHIRRLLAARYGWADCWIGLVADTRRSLAVRLACA